MTQAQSNSDYLLKNPAKVRSVMRSLMEAHQLVSISLDRADSTSISVITSISKDNKYFSLDGVRESVVDKKIVAGSSFSLTTSLDGIDVRADRLKATDTVEVADNQNYLIPLPEQIYYFQRRNTYRAQVTALAKINTSLRIPDSGDSADAEECNLVDVSATGCAITFGGELGNQLAESTEPLVLTLNLQENDETLELAAIVKHSRYLKHSKRWRFGMKFTEIPLATEHRLDKLIAHLQMLERQRK